jgi:hypothetical protein
MSKWQGRDVVEVHGVDAIGSWHYCSVEAVVFLCFGVIFRLLSSINGECQWV